MCLDHFFYSFFVKKGITCEKKHFLVYIFFFEKNCITCAKTFFEFFFSIKKFYLEKKTIICD